MLKEPLYQVHVEQRGGEVIPVGPKLLKWAAEMALVTIKTEIAAGREKTWGNPHLKPCLH